MAAFGEADASRPLGVQQPLEKGAGWSARDARLLVSIQTGILGIVMGTFFYSTLVPALEGDLSLSWSPTDTTHLVTFASATCTLGLFIAGPLADYIRPSKLLGANALVVFVGVVLFAMTTGKYQVMMIICALTFMRAVMWPAANVLLAVNLPSQKHDAAFIFTAFGSRMGDVIGPVLVWVSLTYLGFTWRGTSLLILIVISLFFMMSLSALPQDLKEPEAREQVSLQGLVRKMVRLVTDVDGWLVFTSNLGTYGVWAVYDYAAVLAADTYQLPPGQAAGMAAYISVGSAVGLVVAFWAVNIVGTTGGRAVHVLQSAMSAVALVFLSFSGVPLFTARVLLFVVGFGFVAIAYVPFMIYAARSRADERAFRTAVVDGASQMCSVGFTYIYGTLRAEQGLQGVSAIYLIAATCMAVATGALAIYYRRLHGQEAQEQAGKALGGQEPTP